MSELSSKDKAELRSAAQRLKPAVHIGKNGLGDAVARELRVAFSRSNLVKVAFRGDRELIEKLASEVEAVTQSQNIGGVGKRRSFFRELEAPAEVSDSGDI